MLRGPGLAVVLGLAAEPAGAQIRATLDAGASRVEYDRFLPSSALSLSPSFQVVEPRLAFAARGTWLRFESGNHSLQGLLASSLRLPSEDGTVAELGAELGGSRYDWNEGYAHFFHALGRARLSFPSATGNSGWLAVTGGAAVFDSEEHGSLALAGGLRVDRRDVTLTFTGTGTVVGGIGYADLETGIRHARPSGFEAQASASARIGDPGGDPGPYVEASLTFPVTAYAGLVLAGGRYAEDALRGNIPGRYVTAALRLAIPWRRRPPVRIALPDARSDNEATVAAALVEVRRGRGATWTLAFRVPGADQVELMADFTDWAPIGLQRTAPDAWRVTLAIPPGRHRLNLRVNGGPWGVPAGTTPVADDFQGMVGAVVIP